jgi:predicted metal-dependent peptidase
VGFRGEQLRLLTVDAAVQSVQPVFDIGRVECHGGGGTDMRVGIRAAEELRPRPDAIVVFTDGYTEWPVDRPTARLVVGLVCSAGGSAAVAHAIPEWATVVEIPIDELGSGRAQGLRHGPGLALA